MGLFVCLGEWLAVVFFLSFFSFYFPNVCIHRVA